MNQPHKPKFDRHRVKCSQDHKAVPSTGGASPLQENTRRVSSGHLTDSAMPSARPPTRVTSDPRAPGRAAVCACVLCTGCHTPERRDPSSQPPAAREELTPCCSLLTSVLSCEAVVGALNEDDIVRLKHGLRGGVEVTVEPHVGVGAAVIADLDHPREVTHALQSLGTAAPLLPC